MAGKKKILEPPCFSDAPSNKLCPPTSCGRTLQPSCSANGQRCQNQGLQYSKGDTWDRMLQQGIQLIDRFCQEDRVRIRQPRRHLQIKFTRPVSGINDFVAYVDAIGNLDGERCLIEWKTTSS